MYAVVRLRGDVGLRPENRDTLKLLRLHRVNHCVLLPDDVHYLGMIKKVTNHVAWGEISSESIGRLLQMRGRLKGGDRLTDEYLRENTEFNSIEELSKSIDEDKVKIKDVPNLKPVFRLHPPRKGHKGIKRSFKEGGELGYHGDAINDLLKKMR